MVHTEATGFLSPAELKIMGLAASLACKVQASPFPWPSRVAFQVACHLAGMWSESAPLLKDFADRGRK